MNKIQKQLNFTCQECLSTYQLLEIHEPTDQSCEKNCLAHWKALLHSHFQEQIILFLAHQEKENDPDNHE